MSSTLCRSLTSLHQRGPSRARVEIRLCAAHGRRKGLTTSRLFHTQVWGYVFPIVSKSAICVDNHRLWRAYQAVGSIPTMFVTSTFGQSQKGCGSVNTAVTCLQAVVSVLPGKHRSVVKRLSLLSCKMRLGAKLQVQSSPADLTAMQQGLPLRLPLVLYEALAAALLAVLVLNYQQRPRGWSNHALVQVRSHSMLLPSELVQDLNALPHFRWLSPQ